MFLPYLPPLDTLPTAVIGYVEGPVRLENKTGDTRYLNEPHTFLLFQKPIEGFAVTHLQKKSKFGFLLTWPFCFHIWYTFKYQEGDDVIGWKPGTEVVFYTRTPGYRKDTDHGVKWTWGYFPSLNWD